jgi:hypothetical protein
LDELSLVIPELNEKDIRIPEPSSHYQEDEKPVFFGHYWLSGDPFLIRNNVCCLDFSVAKNGVLASYRMNGETELHKENIVFV